jgi:choline kinase
MKAIILAAGVGKRLGGGSIERPKCLLELGGKTLLDRMLDALRSAGVEKAVIVVGHQSDQIRAAVADREDVGIVHNPEYRKGAIVSLWCAREEFDDDLLVMDADVLFPPALLRRLVDSPHANCFLMDAGAENNGEAMMLAARQGRVVDIARGVRGEYDACGESVGFLKLSRAAAGYLQVLLEQALEDGRDGGEHEEVYPTLMREHVIGYELTDGFRWTEIDFPEDVERAEALVADAGGALA